MSKNIFGKIKFLNAIFDLFAASKVHPCILLPGKELNWRVRSSGGRNASWKRRPLGLVVGTKADEDHLGFYAIL